MVKSRPTAPRKPRPPRDSPAALKRRRANTRLAYDITGIGLVAVALLLLATLLWPAPEGENVFGRAVVAGLRLIVGAGAWGFPFVLLLCGGMLAVGRNRSLDNVGGATLLFLVFVAWWHLGHVPPAGQFARDNLLAYGGYVGAGISFVLRKLAGPVGAHILLTALATGGLIWLIDVPLPFLLGPVDNAVRSGASKGKQAVADGARSAARRVTERRSGSGGAMIPDRPRAHRLGGDSDDPARARPTLYRRNVPEPQVEAEDADDGTIPLRRGDKLGMPPSARPR